MLKICLKCLAYKHPTYLAIYGCQSDNGESMDCDMCMHFHECTLRKVNPDGEAHIGMCQHHIDELIKVSQ